MWSITFPGIVEIIVRTSIVYLLLLIGIRVTGKREVGQLTPFDLVLLLVVSNAVQNAMVGADTSLIGGLVAMTTLLILNYLVARIGIALPRVRSFIDGIPTPLIVHGAIQFQNLHHELLTTDELLGILREHEITHLKDVALATLEVDGSVSVIRTSDSDGSVDGTKFVHTRRRRRHHIRQVNG